VKLNEEKIERLMVEVEEIEENMRDRYAKLVLMHVLLAQHVSACVQQSMVSP
jgi:hypothetical protein